MSGMWKRSHGRTSEAPPDERGGYRYVRPTATAPHLDSTQLGQSGCKPQSLLCRPKPSFVPKQYTHPMRGAGDQHGLLVAQWLVVPMPVGFAVPARCTGAAAMTAFSAADGSAISFG